METQQDLDHRLYHFLLLIDSPNGPPKLKFEDSTIFEIMGVESTQTPFVEGMGTKYLRTGRVNIN